MRNGKEREIKGIYAAVLMVFLVFLLIPILLLLGKSFEGSSGFTLARYGEILTGKDFPGVLGRSIWIASISGVVTTILAFFLAYTIHYTNLPGIWKRLFDWRLWRRCCCPRLHMDLPLSIRLENRGF